MFSHGSKAIFTIFFALFLVSCNTPQPEPTPVPNLPTKTPTFTPTYTPSPTLTLTITSTPTITSSPTATLTPSPTPFAGGGYISYWDYSDRKEELIIFVPAGNTFSKVFSLDELEGEHHRVENYDGFSPTGQYYLFTTSDSSNDSLNTVVFDVLEKKVLFVKSFDINNRNFPGYGFWLNQKLIVGTAIDYNVSNASGSQPAQIQYIDILARSDEMVIPYNGYSNQIEAILSDSNLFVSSKLNETDPIYSRRIIGVNGEIIAILDIDQSIADLIGRNITGETFRINPIPGHEFPDEPEVINNFLYFKKCSISPNYFTCYFLKLDLSTSTITEVFQSPGESIYAHDVSPDNAIVLCRQCSYLNATGSVNNCKLRAYNIKTGEVLFEIKNGDEPVWSPDGQYFIFLDKVIRNGYLESTKLMISDRNGKEIVALIPEIDLVDAPDWFLVQP